MRFEHQNIVFSKLDDENLIPFDLLLLADPSKALIEEYLIRSEVFIASVNGEIIGVIVLFPLSAETAEIKNVAVKEAYQRRGLGSLLIENVVNFAITKGHKTICIGTANTSIGQLYLYQKLGFEITGIKRNFFTENYLDSIFENGIQAKHMLVLSKQLNDYQEK